MGTVWGVFILLVAATGAEKITLKPESSTSFHTLTVCRGQMRSIACPNIQLLHIYNAFYGKLSGHDCTDPVTQLRDQIPTCFSRDAPRIIREACQGQQSCDLYAEDSLYNDPCPSVNKYLFVSFTCQGKSDLPEKLKMFEDKSKDPLLPGKMPSIEDSQQKSDVSSKRMSATVCSGETGNIFCPSLKLLHIQSATYGKQQGRDCKGSKVTRDTIPSCSAHDAVRTVKDMCDGQQSCDLFSEPDLYGRSLCDATTQKYLQVEYTCDGHSNLELQLKSKDLHPQSFAYQPQESPQNPFLRSIILRSNIPRGDPNSQQFSTWLSNQQRSNQQLATLQAQRMSQARALQQQIAKRRNEILKQQQANEHVRQQMLAQRRQYYMQHAAKTRSFGQQPSQPFAPLNPSPVNPSLNAPLNPSINRGLPQVLNLPKQPFVNWNAPPASNIPLNTPLAAIQRMGAQRQEVQYPPQQAAPVLEATVNAGMQAGMQALGPPVQPMTPTVQEYAQPHQQQQLDQNFQQQQQQQWQQQPQQQQSWWTKPAADDSNPTAFNYRHSTCEQCNGDCKNYLCYGCGGCQEPPPEQQTYYYPYQRQDAAYHDAFAGNGMALSGMVIWPLPKLPWKKTEEKKTSNAARSKVEEDEYDDEDDDEDSSGDDVNKKSVKTKSI